MAGPLQDIWDWVAQQYSPSALRANLSPSQNLLERGDLSPSPSDVGSRLAKTGEKIAGIAKGAVGSAWTGSNDPAKQTNDDSDEADIGGKEYKFSTVSGNPEGEVQDYSAQDPNAKLDDLASGPVEGDPKSVMAHQLEELLGGVQNPSDLSPKEYDALTKQASKGNQLAQQILVKGKFQAKNYPTEAQDLAKIEDPFVQALSGLPALAQNEQNAANKVTQPYDFSNAESQVNNLLGQMGSSMTMSTSPETQSYLNTLGGIVGSGANNLTQSNLGIPSIMSALGGLGPAAAQSTKATPYASLLAALLGHEQYEIEYGGVSPNSSQTPNWLQNLIASVTGTAVGGGLVSPTVAAGSVGSTPSTSATPTGSNA